LRFLRRKWGFDYWLPPKRKVHALEFENNDLMIIMMMMMMMMMMIMYCAIIQMWVPLSSFIICEKERVSWVTWLFHGIPSPLHLTRPTCMCGDHFYYLNLFFLVGSYLCLWEESNNNFLMSSTNIFIQILWINYKNELFLKFKLEF
jgi:hypothetical protein